LIVDDNIWDARLLRKLFEAQARFEIIEAHSAKQALGMFEEGLPDLIILDLILPEINGFNLLKTIRSRKRTKDIPVVVVSGKDLHGEERSKLAQEVDSVWMKGVLDRNSLLSHVESILAK
jgi:threonine synthase